MAGYFGVNGAPDAGDHGGAAWLWAGPPDRTDQRRCFRAELRHALSRVAEAGAGGSDCFRVGRFGEQPEGEILQPDTRREEAACQRAPRMGADNRNPGTLSRAGGGSMMITLRRWLQK